MASVASVHGRRGAVVGQLQVHAVRGALSGHHALQHVGLDGSGVVAGGCRVHRQVSHLSVGSQHLSQGGQRDVVGPSVEELVVLQQQCRSRRVLLHLRRVAGLKGCVQDLEAVTVHRSSRLLGRPAPEVQLGTPFGGTVKYILAVLQAPWSPTKLPYRGS